MGLASFLIVAPWVLRGLLLSGCIAYPLPFGCFTSLEWSVPARFAEAEFRWIKSWARQPYLAPEVVLSSWDWFIPWTLRFFSSAHAKYFVGLTVGLVIFGTLFLVVSLLRHEPLRVRKSCFASPLLISFGALVFWLTAAPDPRFAHGYLLSLVSLVFCLGLFQIRFSELDKKVRGFLFALFVLALFARSGIEMTPLVERVHLTEWPVIPEARVIRMETMEGLKIYTPAGGDQCWAAPMPCTPAFRRNLHVELSEAGMPKMFWFSE